ncbi:MAG TPA: spore coat U domain-containing protein [Vicinamibacterales bacterium]|nr:spore coat U domain-containing protein [Vicinamibacterales bacterium]
MNKRPSLRTLAVVVAVLCCSVAGAAGQQRKPKPPDAQQFRCWFLGRTIIEFGYYDPFSPSDLLIQGHLEYQCSETQAPPSRSTTRSRSSGRAKPTRHPIEISFSTGLGGDYNPRTMTGTGTDRLEYNLYRDAARTQIWGDGTRGTSTLAGDVGASEVTATAIVYGRMPAGQNVTGGAFFDVIVMTIDF